MLRPRTFVQGLSKNFDNGFSLSWVSAAHKIENYDVRGQHTLCEGLGLDNHFKLSDRVAGDRHGRGIFLDHCAEELVSFTSGLNHNIVVTHLLEQALANQTVAAGYQNALAFDLWLNFGASCFLTIGNILLYI
jgi:hypothetical protein